MLLLSYFVSGGCGGDSGTLINNQKVPLTQGLDVGSLRLGALIGLTSAKCLTINADVGNEIALTDRMPYCKRGTGLAPVVILLREVRKGSHGNYLKPSRLCFPHWSPARPTSGPASNT